jgi:hypothetical protein
MDPLQAYQNGTSWQVSTTTAQKSAGSYSAAGSTLRATILVMDTQRAILGLTCKNVFSSITQFHDNSEPQQVSCQRREQCLLILATHCLATIRKERPMRLTKSTNRNLLISFAIVVGLLIVTAPALGAATDVSLPTSPVYISVTRDTVSYFVTTLSGVPSGNFSVQNATYSGWCIDLTSNMTFGQLFLVNLYSSLSPPPGNLSSVQWNMVNYILNHKQGTNQDIQEAIWYFANMIGGYTPNSTIAKAMVNDSLANGTNFIPQFNQTIAIICLPQIVSPGGPPVQDSIIEVSVPPASPLTLNVVVSGDAQSVGTNSYHMNSGASATFTANVQGGTQPYSYTWYVNGTTNGSNESMNFTAQQTGTYLINVNVSDSENPTQQVPSPTITVIVPEYPWLVIALLCIVTLPVIVSVRKNRVKT